jgi:hypothetical protein
LTLRELKQIRDALIASLNALYHARIDYPGFNVPDSKATAKSDLSEELGVTYQKASDVPINASGEVEDEAISRK